MFSDPLSLLAVLCLNVVVSELLCRKTFFRHVGTALMVIVVTGIEVNLGVVPAYDDSVAVYSATFSHVVYFGIFWLLLGVQLKDLLQAGGPMISLFVLGSLGTMVGVVIGMWAVDGLESIGPKFHALGGMFAATYTGGSANFNMVAAEYEVHKEGALYVGTAAVDAILTTIWMVATIAIPRFLNGRFPGRRKLHSAETEDDALGLVRDTESIHPLDLGLLLGLAAASLAGAQWIGAATGVPMALVLTTLALVLAQVPAVARLRGGRTLGMFAVYLFLAVIGALCDLSALESLGSLAGTLWLFASVVVFVHGLIVFGGAALFRADWDMAAVASQANVGGGTSAIALARSLGRSDLVLPAILVGSLGTALGTYLGFAVAGWLAV